MLGEDGGCCRKQKREDSTLVVFVVQHKPQEALACDVEIHVFGIEGSILVLLVQEGNDGSERNHLT